MMKSQTVNATKDLRTLSETEILDAIEEAAKLLNEVEIPGDIKAHVTKAQYREIAIHKDEEGGWFFFDQENNLHSFATKTQAEAAFNLVVLPAVGEVVEIPVAVENRRKVCDKMGGSKETK